MILGIAIGSVWTLIGTALIYEAVFAHDSSPAPKPTAAASKGLAEWERMWYDTAHSDIQWSKEHAWTAMQTLALFEAAVVAAKKTFFATVNLDLLTIIVAVASLLTVIHLVDLHRFARKARVIADRLLAEVPEQLYYLGPPRAHDRHHVFYLAIKLGVVGVVTTLAVLGLP